MLVEHVQCRGALIIVTAAIARMESIIVIVRPEHKHTCLRNNDKNVQYDSHPAAPAKIAPRHVDIVHWHNYPYT